MSIPLRRRSPWRQIVLKGVDAVRLTGAHRCWKPRTPTAKSSSNWVRRRRAPPSMKSPSPRRAIIIRAACNSGHVLQGFDLTIDGRKATRESVPYLDMTLGITRRPYSTHNLWWIRAGRSRSPRARTTYGPLAPRAAAPPYLGCDCRAADEQHEPRQVEKEIVMSNCHFPRKTAVSVGIAGCILLVAVLTPRNAAVAATIISKTVERISVGRPMENGPR